MSPAESGSAAVHFPASESKSKIEMRSPLDHCWCLHTLQCTEGCRSQVPFNMDSIDKTAWSIHVFNVFLTGKEEGGAKICTYSVARDCNHHYPGGRNCT